MNKSFFFLLVSTIFISGEIWCQEDNFSAEIQTSEKDTLKYAYVVAYADSLYQNPFYNSQLVNKEIKIAVPDSLSCFYLEISHLNYSVFREGICRPFQKKKIITLTRKIYNLDEVVLEGFEDTKITVVGNISEIRPGKIVGEIEGVNATDIIKSLPGVFVLPGNEIKIRGRKVKEIYLHTSPNSPGINISKERLQNITSENIERITALNNEAELHVYLKKIKPGYAGDIDLNLNYGREFYSSFSPDFVYNKRETTFWLDSQIGTIHKNPTSAGSYKVDAGQNVPQILTSKSNTDQKTQYFETNLMVEHQFDSIYTGGAQIGYSINKNIMERDLISNIRDHGRNSSITNEDNNSYFFTPAAYLKAMYNSGWSLTLKSGFLTSLQESVNEGTFNYFSEEKSFVGDQFLMQHIKTNAFINQIEIKKKLDKTTLTLEAKNENLNVKTYSDFHQKLINSVIPDSTFSNRLKENKFTLQTKINTTLFKKYLFNFTSSFLWYRYDYNSLNIGTLAQNNLETWLPSVSISIPLKEAKYLTLFGSSYLRAPNLRNIVFNRSTGDGYVVNKNNYNLKPSITYQIGASFSPIKNVNSSLYWSRTKNMYMNYPYFSFSGALEGNRKINLNNNNTIGLNLFYSNTFFEAFFLSSNVNLNYQNWENQEDFPFSTEFTSLLMNHALYYSTKNDWSFHIDYTYSSNQQLSDMVGMKGYSWLNFGVSKSINSHWSLFCNFQNILNSYRPKLYSLSPDILYNSTIDFDSRYISFGINYEFEKRIEEKNQEKSLMNDLNKRIEIQNQ